MNATISLDEDLFAKARALTGEQDQSALVNRALKIFVERESAKRLIELGGTEPDLVAPPRRRFE